VPAEFRIGDYEILRKIAVGGMGTVYAAMRYGPADFGKLVAIKLLHPHLELGESARRRFAGEARIGARLSHPNIVEVLGFEHTDEGHCIVMEYVHGGNLAALVRARGEPLPVPEALLVTCEVLKGLEAVHGFHTWTGEPQPVIHRDVSPKNVLVSVEGEVKLADFGVALISGAETFTTATGLRGTVSYMSPEQARAEKVDQRSDLYSVGLVLTELLTGERVFDGANEIEILNKAQRGISISIELPPDAAPVLGPLQRALSADRERRHPDAATFRAELETTLERVGYPSRDAVAQLVRPHVGEINELMELAKERGRVTQALSSGPTSRRRSKVWAAAVGVLFSVGAVLAYLLATPAEDPALADRPVDAAAVQPLPSPDLPRPDRLPPDLARPDLARPDIGLDARRLRDKRVRRHPNVVRHGILHLNTVPAWSRVWIDGRRRGTTPIRLRLRAGWHRVKLLVLGRGRPVNLRVRVRPDRTTKRVVRVKP
jgi:serine/threonine-protein kinase